LDVSPRFWVEWCALVRSINPQAYTVGEIWEQAPEWLRGDRYDAVMNYPTAFAMKDFFINNSRGWTAVEFDEELRKLRDNYRAETNHLLQVLIDSHDTDRLGSMLRNPNRNYDRNASLRDDKNYDPRRPNWGQRHVRKLVAAFQLTCIGAPMIYYGAEAGMWGGDDPDDRKPMVWPDLSYENETYGTVSRFTESDTVGFDQELFDYYRKLIAIHRRHPAFQDGEFATVLTSGQVYAYSRTSGPDTVIVALNNDDHERWFNLQVPWAMADDELNGKRYFSTDGMVQMYLPAKGVAILLEGEAR
jgi:glycosidase